MGSPLRVTDDDPLKVHISELLGSDFSRIGSEAKGRDILSCYLNMLVLLGEHDSHQVQENW